MKLHRDLKVEKVASTDKTRQVIGEPYLRGNVLWSTDGRAMVRIPVELGEHDVDGFVTGNALQAARKVDKRCELIQLTANGCLSLKDGQSFPRPSEKNGEMPPYPNCDQVWEPMWKGETDGPEIAFDVRKLAAIADALGVDAVKIQAVKGQNALRVSPCGTRKTRICEPNARAVLIRICTT
jgi:hypothetical protein